MTKTISLTHITVHLSITNIVCITPNVVELYARMLRNTKLEHQRSNTGTDMTDHDMNPMEEECFVMGLEVLDNLPHDKIKWCDETEQWMETHVVRTQDDGLREEYRPLQDSLISETLKLFPPPSKETIVENDESLLSRVRNMFSSTTSSSSKAAFIPTGAVRLIHSLKKTFPSHRLILADFDHLPSPDVCGVVESFQFFMFSLFHVSTISLSLNIFNTLNGDVNSNTDTSVRRFQT